MLFIVMRSGVIRVTRTISRCIRDVINSFSCQFINASRFLTQLCGNGWLKTEHSCANILKTLAMRILSESNDAYRSSRVLCLLITDWLVAEIALGFGFVGSFPHHASVRRWAHTILYCLHRGSGGNQKRRLAHGAHGLSLPLSGDVSVSPGALQPGQTGAAARG